MIIKKYPPEIQNNQSLTILPETNLDDENSYVGYKIDTFKKINRSYIDEKGNKVPFYYEIDKSVPTIYDDTTKEILEKQKNKDNIEALQSMLSQSIANNAKTNIALEKANQINANLMQEVAKIKIKMGD